jgi:peroxiredoxin
MWPYTAEEMNLVNGLEDKNMRKGMKVPSVTFKCRVRDESIGGDNPFKWKDKNTVEFFGDKRVLVFSLPGAFTPTCSTYQVPGFEKNYDKFKELGIDEIYVISVNDAFVMRKWMIDQGVEKIKFIPDGNGEFTRRMGMLINKEHLGFGYRSWRYAMIVTNGIIEHWFEEPGINDTGNDDDPYGETSPANVLVKLLEK